MSILVHEGTRVLVQGLSGRTARLHARRMVAAGTRVVCGVTPGRRGEVDGIPLYPSVREARERTGANASIAFVPPRHAASALLEALEAGLPLLVSVTEGIPVHDQIEVHAALRARPETRLIGPNSPGLISPGRCLLGVMPASPHRPGTVGLISRSGTLSYEAAAQLADAGLGLSTAVGIGGDALPGTGFVPLLQLFEQDPETEALLLIGEIGGGEEEEVAAHLRAHPCSKPVLAYVAGASAPPGRTMGHAGAIIERGSGDAASKTRALREAGVQVIHSAARIGDSVAEILCY